MVRAAVAACLVGCAAALALSNLHIVAGAPGALIAAYWPAVLVVAGVAGLVAPSGARRPWAPVGCLTVGAGLLAAHLYGIPVGRLAWAALCCWAGVMVAFSGRARVRR